MNGVLSGQLSLFEHSLLLVEDIQIQMGIERDVLVYSRSVARQIDFVPTSIPTRCQ